jgi:hypothetical protein
MRPKERAAVILVHNTVARANSEQLSLGILAGWLEEMFLEIGLDLLINSHALSDLASALYTGQ